MLQTMTTKVQALDKNGQPVQVGDVVRFWLTDWLTYTETGHPQIEVIGEINGLERNGGRGPWLVVVVSPFVGPAPWRKPASVVEKIV